MTFLLKRILAFLPGGFLVALSTIGVEHEDKDGLVLNSDGWLTEFNKTAKLVSRSGTLVASFGSILSVDVEHYINGKRFEWWVLNLTLQGGKKLFIGRSTDSVEVSIVAAHVAEAVSKRVRAVERVGF